MSFKIKTAATTYPVTLAELKEHLRLPSAYTDEDNRLNFFIQAATAVAERMTNRQMMTATWYLYMNDFPRHRKAIILAKSPVQSVTSVKYKDTAGTLQTLPTSLYVVNTSEEPCTIKPLYDEIWPDTNHDPSNVIVEFVAGYDAAASVPANIRAGIFLLCADFWAYRETILVGHIVQNIPVTAETLFDLERVISYESNE